MQTCYSEVAAYRKFLFSLHDLFPPRLFPSIYSSIMTSTTSSKRRVQIKKMEKRHEKKKKARSLGSCRVIVSVGGIQITDLSLNTVWHHEGNYVSFLASRKQREGNKKAGIMEKKSPNCLIFGKCWDYDFSIVVMN